MKSTVSSTEDGYTISHVDLGAFDLPGYPAYEAQNAATFLESVNYLMTLYPGIEKHVGAVFLNYKSITGLKGRWQQIADSPRTIADTGHNVDGVRSIVSELSKLSFNKLHIVWGTVNDKDLDPILSILPKDAFYYFCKPQIDRGFPSKELRNIASDHGLSGVDAGTVSDAIDLARTAATRRDLIFIGGSTFVVAEIEEL